MHFNDFENQLKSDIDAASLKIKDLEADAKYEETDNHIAAKILVKLLENKAVQPDEIQFLKAQSLDMTTILALIGFQAIPGSSVALIVLEKMAEKHGFSIFPKIIKNPNITE